MSILDIISNYPLFYDLYEKEVELIVKDAEVHKFNEGDWMVNQGEESDEMFFIIKGEAQVEK